MKRSVRTRAAVAILAVLLGLSPRIRADLVNGNFESGSFGWSRSPTDSVLFQDSGLLDPDGSTVAKLLEATGPLAPEANTDLWQTFTLPSGVTALRFDYRFEATGEGPSETDSLQVFLNGVKHDDVASSEGMPSYGDYLDGTWTVDLSGFTSDPSLTVLFRLAGELDGFTTTVLIDNVTTVGGSATVPLPGAVLLASLGFGCAGWRVRRVRV